MLYLDNKGRLGLPLESDPVAAGITHGTAIEIYNSAHVRIDGDIVVSVSTASPPYILIRHAKYPKILLTSEPNRYIPEGSYIKIRNSETQIDIAGPWVSFVNPTSSSTDTVVGKYFDEPNYIKSRHDLFNNISPYDASGVSLININALPGTSYSPEILDYSFMCFGGTPNLPLGGQWNASGSKIGVVLTKQHIMYSTHYPLYRGYVIVGNTLTNDTIEMVGFTSATVSLGNSTMPISSYQTWWESQNPGADWTTATGLPLPETTNFTDLTIQALKTPLPAYVTRLSIPIIHEDHFYASSYNNPNTTITYINNLWGRLGIANNIPSVSTQSVLYGVTTFKEANSTIVLPVGMSQGDYMARIAIGDSGTVFFGITAGRAYFAGSVYTGNLSSPPTFNIDPNGLFTSCFTCDSDTTCPTIDDCPMKPESLVARGTHGTYNDKKLITMILEDKSWQVTTDPTLAPDVIITEQDLTAGHTADFLLFTADNEIFLNENVYPCIRDADNPFSSDCLPLSNSTYLGRNNTNFNIGSNQYTSVFEYVNYTHHGFFGGISIQAQELNEIQEVAAGQSSLHNILMGNWMSEGRIPTDIIVPIVKSTDSNVSQRGWYLHTTKSGFDCFINLPTQNSNSTLLFKKRYITQANNDILEDNSVYMSSSLYSAGAHRIQFVLIGSSSYEEEDTTHRTLNYTTWATHFAGGFFDATTMMDSIPGSSGFGGDGYLLDAMVPLMRLPPSLNSYNGLFRLPESPSYTPTDEMWDAFVTRLNAIPLERRCVWISHTAKDINPDARKNYNYYKNTADGISYQGNNILSPWMEVNLQDGIIATNSIINKFQTSNISFKWLLDDKEGGYVWTLDGFHASSPLGFDLNGFPIDYPADWQPPTPNHETFAAIIKDIRFTTKENPYTGLTFGREFENNFHALAAAYASDTGLVNRLAGRTYGALMSQWMEDGITNYFNPAYIWQPGYDNPNAGITGLEAKFGDYELYHFVRPAWRATIDNLQYINYNPRMNQDLFDVNQLFNGALDPGNELEHAQRVIQYPISAEESRFTQDSNNLPIFSPIELSSYSIDHYAFNTYNIMFPSWISPITDGVESSQAVLTDFNNTFPLLAGYVKSQNGGAFTDREKYSWVGYLVRKYNGAAGDGRIIRYPTTNPIVYENGVTFIDRGKFSKFRTEYVYKHLLQNIKLLRSSFRSVPDMWTKYSPFVMAPNHVETAFSVSRFPISNFTDNSATRGYWYELMYHILLHSPIKINFFDNTYIPQNAHFIQRVLEEWKLISGNRKVIPVSTTTGDMATEDTPLERIVLHEAFDKGLISGGKLENGEYLWRISVPPEFIKYKYYRYKDAVDVDDIIHKEYIADTIILDKDSGQNHTQLPNTITIDCTGTTWASEPTGDKFAALYAVDVDLDERRQHSRGVWLKTTAKDPPKFTPRAVSLETTSDCVPCPPEICKGTPNSRINVECGV